MTELQKSDKIFVAGHAGLIGSAIIDALNKREYENIITRSRAILNLLDEKAIHSFYSCERPDVVILAAGKVGGIIANNTYPAEFIYENLTIQNNVIWAAHCHDVRRLIFLGSSCIYPRNAPQPISECSLLTGPLEQTNRPYALAKIAGLELVQSLRRQFKRSYFSVMPTNLYGPQDNFHPENSHVLPALVRRFCDAADRNLTEVVVWGTGSPLREFLHSRDCADAILFLTESLTDSKLNSLPIAKEMCSHINIGSGVEISIRDLAFVVKEASGFKGKIKFDSSKPDGTPRKLLDSSILTDMGWRPKIELEDGVREVVSRYRERGTSISMAGSCQKG